MSNRRPPSSYNGDSTWKILYSTCLAEFTIFHCLLMNRKWGWGRGRTVQLDLLVLGFDNNDNISSQIDHSGGFQKGQVQELEYITRVQDGFLERSSRPQAVSASSSLPDPSLFYPVKLLGRGGT